MPLPARLDLYALVSRATALQKVAATDGGEWSGACPWCGGADRFRVWPEAARPHYWCRGCDQQGDTIEWLRRFYHLSFPDAQAALGQPLDPLPARDLPRRPAPKPVAPPPIPPVPPWQVRAASVIAQAQAVLWSSTGDRARAYLHDVRGLTDSTLETAAVGYLPRDTWDDPTAWGLDGARVALPAGILLPTCIGETCWGLKVRRPGPAQPKYHLVRGSRTALYGVDQLQGHAVVLLVEGEFDALLLRQIAGDLVDVVTLGSAKAPLAIPWRARLLPARLWLVAYDLDTAGNDGAATLGALSARVRRVRPIGGADLGAMHQAGGDLRAWVGALIARHSTPPPTTPVATPTPPQPTAEPAPAEDRAPPPIVRCYACDGATYWPYPDGSGWVCATCHPPSGSQHLHRVAAPSRWPTQGPAWWAPSLALVTPDLDGLPPE